MNAYEIPNLRFSLPAGEAVARQRFVAVDANGAAVIASAGGAVIGVSMTQAAIGEVLDIADGIVPVEASDEIAAGALVSVAADGKAVTATPSSQAADTPFAVTEGTVVVGVAITGAAAAGQFLTVKIG